MTKKNTFTLTNSASGDSMELDVKQGTMGPDVVDIGSLYKQMKVFTYDPGFVSTGSCESKITFIDGEKGVLLYRGYPVDQLAEHSNFIEVAYLLLYGDLPSKEELTRFRTSITRHTMINEALLRFFNGFRNDAHPMAMVSGVIGSMSAFYHDSMNSHDPVHREIFALRVIA